MMTRGQLHTKPYRDLSSAAFMAALCAAVALLLSISFVNALGIFPEPFLTHIGALLNHPEYYKIFLAKNWLRALPFYLIPALFTIGAGAAAALWFGRIINPIKHLEGRKLLRGEEAHRASEFATKNEVKASGYGLKIHPNLQFARHQELTSFLFLAGQRGGKTQILSRLENAAWQRGDRTIAFDFKGDFTEITPPTADGAHPLIFMPWDGRKQNNAVWDIAADIDAIHKARSFAAGIVPVSEKDPLWGNAARALLVAVIVKLYTENGSNWGWKMLGEAAYLPVTDLKEIAEQYYPPAVAIVADAESKTTASVMVNLHAFLTPLFDLQTMWGDLSRRKLSLNKWLRNDNTKYKNLVIQGNAMHNLLSQALIKSMIETLVTILSDPAFPQSRDNRIFCLMDEFVQYGRIDSVRIIPELLASRGISLIISLQTIDSLESLYGKEIKGIFSSLFQTKIFGRIMGASDVKWVQEQVGKKLVSRPTRTFSGNGTNAVNISQGIVEEEKEVVTALGLSRLGMFSVGVGGKKSDIKDVYIRSMVLGHGNHLLEIEWPLWVHKKYRPAHIPLPSAKPQAQAKTEPSREVFEPSKAARAAASNSVMAQLPTETTPEAAHAAEATDNKIKSEMLEILSVNEPQKPTEITQNNEDAMQEIVGEVAQSSAIHVLAEAVGVPSIVFELAENLADLQAPITQDTDSNLVSQPTKKRIRKQVKYAHENT